MNTMRKDNTGYLMAAVLLVVAILAVAAFQLINAPRTVVAGTAATAAELHAREVFRANWQALHAVDAETARWEAMGRFYASQQAASNAETARWEAMGRFYGAHMAQNAVDAETARWEAMGKFYASHPDVVAIPVTH